jgi:serine/threonine-protein kinase
VTRQAANGLAAAHAQDIVHRDVKPQNLVLLEDGTVKVVDFGLAGVAQISGGRVGTPHFMSPETCETGEATTKSDVYSLGITLYHLLTGQPPYAGEDVPSILRSHTRGAPLRPEMKRPGLPREVADLVRALTLQSPSGRPTAAQVVESIDGFGGEAMQEKATLRRRRRRSRAHVAPGRSSSSSSGALLFAVFVVVGLIVAIIALGSTGDDGAKKESSPTPTDTAGPSRPSVPAQPTPPGPSTPTPASPGPDRQPDAPAPPSPAEAEAAGNTALFEAEQWARRHWKTTDDDEGVIAEYRKVRNQHPGTAAAKEAETRIREIRSHKRHAHPDKEFSEADEVLEAQTNWEETRPQIEALIAKHAYVSAKGLLPAGARDGAGTIGKELAFWDAFLTHLIQFKNTMSTWVPKLPEERRTIVTARGEGLVEQVSPQHLSVRIDGRLENVLWTDVEPAALASLARSAFQAAPRGSSLYTMAFAFAHRLWEAFWAADFDVGMDEAVDPNDFMLKEYKRRVEDRKAEGPGGR